MSSLMTFIITLMLTFFAYWHRDRALYVLCGLALIAYGFFYFTSSGYLSILLVLFGIFSFIKAWWDRPKRTEG